MAGTLLLVGSDDLDFLSKDQLSVGLSFHSPPGLTGELREVHRTQADGGLKELHHPGPPWVMVAML